MGDPNPFESNTPMPKPLITAILIPILAVGYITVMGSTGICPVCETILTSVTGGDKTETISTPTSSSLENDIPPRDLKPILRAPVITLDGETTTLAEFAGKPMLIEVWATWCAPCRTVRKMLTRNHKEISEVANVVCLSVDEGGPSVVRNYLRKNPAPGMHEFMATSQIRGIISRHTTSYTIPQLVYVAPDGTIMNIDSTLPNVPFMIAMLRNLENSGRSDG